MRKIAGRIIFFLTGIAIGVRFAEKILAKPLYTVQEESIKFQALFKMMGAWMELKQEGKCVAEYFEKKGYKKIAIYGMGLAGQILYNELNKTNIQVLYVIDKNKEGILSETEIYSPEEPLPVVDMIIVSAITYYEEILEMLQGKVMCDIVSLEGIIYELRDQ